MKIIYSCVWERQGVVDAGGRGFWERINLAEHLAENDGDSRRYELDIAGYHGWNIYSYDEIL